MVLANGRAGGEMGNRKLTLSLFTCRFAFVELPTAEIALIVEDQLNGYKLDKTHILRANRYDKIDELTSISDEYAEPDPQDYEPKEILRSWLLDPRPIDQYAISHNDVTEIHWNETQRTPEPLYQRKVSFTLAFSEQDFIVDGFEMMNNNQAPSSD